MTTLQNCQQSITKTIIVTREAAQKRNMRYKRDKETIPKSPTARLDWVCNLYLASTMNQHSLVSAQA